MSDTAKYCRKAFAYLDRCPAAKYIFTEEADKRACLPLPRAFDSRLIMNASRRFGRRLVEDAHHERERREALMAKEIEIPIMTRAGITGFELYSLR